MAKRKSKAKNKDAKSVRDQLADLSSNSLIAGLMIVATLVVAGSIVASKVFIGELAFNNRVLGAKREVNGVLAQNVNNLEDLAANFEALRGDGIAPADVLRALPTSHDFANLSGQLELLASLSGAQLLTVTLSGDSAVASESAEASVPTADPAATELAPTAEGVQPATFTISANGSYQSLVTFITATEVFVRPIQINAVKLSGSEPSVVVELTITTYYQSRTEVGNETRTIQ